MMKWKLFETIRYPMHRLNLYCLSNWVSIRNLLVVAIVILSLLWILFIEKPRSNHLLTSWSSDLNCYELSLGVLNRFSCKWDSVKSILLSTIIICFIPKYKLIMHVLCFDNSLKYQLKIHWFLQQLLTRYNQLNWFQ